MSDRARVGACDDGRGYTGLASAWLVSTMAIPSEAPASARAAAAPPPAAGAPQGTPGQAGGTAPSLLRRQRAAARTRPATRALVRGQPPAPWDGTTTTGARSRPAWSMRAPRRSRSSSTSAPPAPGRDPARRSRAPAWSESSPPSGTPARWVTRPGAAPGAGPGTLPARGEVASLRGTPIRQRSTSPAVPRSCRGTPTEATCQRFSHSTGAGRPRRCLAASSRDPRRASRSTRHARRGTNAPPRRSRSSSVLTTSRREGAHSAGMVGPWGVR